MEPNDETLMAYADGELDAPTREALARRLAAEPRLAARVAGHQALRRRVAGAHDTALSEPVPERLRALLQPTPERVGDDKIIDLAAARAAKQAPRRWQMREWAAMAACLVLGVFAGQIGLRLIEGGPFESRDGRLLARGALERALTQQLASAPPADAAVSVQLSFVSSTGRYCRSFAWRQDSDLSGLACRVGPRWQIEVLAGGTPGQTPAGGLRQAATAIAPEVLRAAEARMQGEALDAAAERAAQAAGWRR